MWWCDDDDDDDDDDGAVMTWQGTMRSVAGTVLRPGAVQDPWINAACTALQAGAVLEGFLVICFLISPSLTLA